MSRRWVLVSLSVILTLAFATALWAQPARHARTRSRAPVAAKAVTRTTVSPTPAGTRAEVVPFYRHKYTTLRTHDGAPQCWSTCWSAYGNPLHPDAGAATQLLLWQNLNAQYRRVSQCEQTCWDRHHPGATQEGVLVAGVRSVPRRFVAATPTSDTGPAQSAAEEPARVATEEAPALPETTYPAGETRPASVVVANPSLDATTQYWSAGGYSAETPGLGSYLSTGGFSLGGAYGGTVFGATPGGNSGLLTFPNDSSLATYPTYMPLFGTATY